MIISKTPLRMSFFGGGSDLPAYYNHFPGSVISSSIDKYVYVIIKERYDDKIYVNYSKKEIVDNVDEIQHDLVRESLKMANINSSVEITTLSDITSKGSGLGSSSAITVGLLNAFYQYQGVILSKEDLAKKACEIEINICNHPIGKQDQYGCALGGLNRLYFNKDRDVTFKKINFKLSLLKKNLFLINTKITRDANIILKNQSENASEVMKENISLVENCDKFENILNGTDSQFDDFGILLNDSWEIKKKMSKKISNEQIDTLYNKGIDAGATGGKVLGAGGGGYILFYVPKQNHRKFNLLFEKDIENFAFENHGTRIVYNDN